MLVITKVCGRAVETILKVEGQIIKTLPDLVLFLLKFFKTLKYNFCNFFKFDHIKLALNRHSRNQMLERVNQFDYLGENFGFCSSLNAPKDLLETPSEIAS